MNGEMSSPEPTPHESLARIRALAEELVAGSADPYEAGRDIWAAAMDASSGDSLDGERCWALWLLWGALTDWVEQKPGEKPQAEESMRDAPVSKIDDEERVLLCQIETFAELSPSAQWKSLIAIEPRLAGHAADLMKSDASDTSRRPKQLRQELASLVRPHSAIPDPLIRSRTALDAAIAYLMDKRTTI